ncbi:MAG: glycosyltransferase family 2 protein [Lachnospiraceae bacterium]|nr:glycosyltransferase family 2 protein [Lachnospiraceae bacterium]
MKVSVIMPVYNREDYVEEAIRSILNQTFEDFELIVIDDYSTDRTTSVVESIIDSRIRLIKAPFKSNIPILRNAGIAMAQGKYIAFMDSDDISSLDRLEKQVQFLETHPEYGVIGGQNHMFGKRDYISEFPLTNEEITGAMPLRCVLSIGNSMIRKTVFDCGIKLHSEFFVCEDYALWGDLLGKTKMANLSEVILHVRYGDQQTTGKSWKDPLQLALRKSILKEVFRASLANLNISFSEAELELYTYGAADTVRFSHITNEICKEFENLLKSMETRLEMVHPELVGGFHLEADRKMEFLRKLSIKQGQCH